MIDISGVGGPSGYGQGAQGSKIEDMKQYLQELDDQVGKCLKAAKDSKEKLMQQIMQNIEQLHGKVQSIQATHPGIFNTPEMTQLNAQLGALTSDPSHVTPEDLTKLATTIQAAQAHLH